MGISWRQFITIDQQVAGERLDGKKPSRHDKGPYTRVHCRQFRRTPTIRILRTNRKTHTSDTRESLRLDGIISASISVSRTIEIVSLSPFVPGHLPISFAFDSFMTVDLNGFGTCFFFPQNSTTWEIGCVTSARVTTTFHLVTRKI